MNNLMWPPEVIGRLTLAQLVCLASEKPPDPAPAPKWEPR